MSLCDQFISHIPSLALAEDNLALVKSVSEEEIYEAIQQFDLNKAPCMDGFTAHFYKTYWSIIKFDLVRMIQYVHKFARMGGATNLVFLALIPKENNVSFFERFMPISLCNVSYKIMSKVIANRLKKILSKLILPNQGGFVEKR